MLVEVVPMRIAAALLAETARGTLHRLTMIGSPSLARLQGQQLLLLPQALTRPTRQPKIGPPS